MANFHRKDSTIINLRLFHNWVKVQLYNKIADDLRKNNNNNNDINILELAVGRGGDLYKWMGINAKSVVGVDIDKESIFGKNGAVHRFNKVKHSNKYDSIPYCKFYEMDLSKELSFIKLKSILGNRKFNIIACQFAFHYFFESEAALNNILNIISHFIADNGYFVLTTMNGNMIKDKIKNKKHIENSVFKITKNYNNKSLYGQQYNISLGAKNEDHYFSQNESTEYIVDMNELNKKFKAYGFINTSTKQFSSWYDEYEKTDNNEKLSEAEKEFSFFNFSAIYQKK